MEKIFLTELYTNTINSIIALVIIIIAYLIVNRLVLRKVESSRQKQAYKARSFYITLAVFLFILAKIWVEGFSHFFAILGLISAALVVANKETIMNFIGCFVITWRGLFTENDLIHIQQYKGHVKTMGLLYFTLNEVSEGNYNRPSGRVIKVPNGLITNNILVNLSQNSHLLEQSISLIISTESNLEHAILIIKESVDQIIADFYKSKKEYTLEYLTKKNKILAKAIELESTIDIQPRFDKPAGVELKIQFYSFSKDAHQLRQKIWHQLLSNQELNLAYSS